MPQTAPSGCVGTSRRQFLKASGVAMGAAATFPAMGVADDKPRRPRVAAVFTTMFYRSHAHVILENFLVPYLFNGQRIDPPVDVVSFYVDQFPDNDIARQVARKFNIPVYKSIEEALCTGGDELAVDAVLSIGEHGDYPHNDIGQQMYPQKRFFDAEVAVMKKAQRFIPIFNDKHLSWRYAWAKEMVDTARELGIPLMSGSSVPLAVRRPALELQLGFEVAEAVSVHGGPVERYDFHGLEVLQSLVEFRGKGETGVSEVEFLTGDALWKAAAEGRWSADLAEVALAAEFGERPKSLRGLAGDDAHGILLTYRDGMRASVLKIGSSSTRFDFAARLKRGEKTAPEPVATSFYVGPWNNRNLFKALAHAIQQHFVAGESPYPVGRTLLTSGLLEAAMRSRHAKKPLATPHLEIVYQPRDFSAMREMGKSWQIITDQTPQPRLIEPVGIEQ